MPLHSPFFMASPDLMSGLASMPAPVTSHPASKATPFSPLRSVVSRFSFAPTLHADTLSAASKTESKSQSQGINIPWRKLVAGSIAGTADVWACHALDRVKTHMQGNPHLGVVGGFKDIWSKGGIFALYEGIWPMTAEAIAKVGARYFIFNFFVDLYKDRVLGDPTIANPGIAANMVCGALAGVGESVIVVIPCEMLKVRHMTQATNESFGLVMRNVIRDEGVAALYKGGSATLLRQVTNHMIRFPVFYSTKQYLQGDSTAPLPAHYNLFAGAFAGMCSTLCNTPLDVIKTRMQSQGHTLDNIGTIRAIYADGGIRAFWAGVWPRVLRVAPGQAITWAVFEKVSQLIGKD